MGELVRGRREATGAGIVELLADEKFPVHVGESILTLTSSKLRSTVLRGVKVESVSKWVVGLCLYRIEKEKLWATWRGSDNRVYRSMTQWLETEVPEIDKGQRSRLAWAASMALEQDASVRERLFRYSPYRVAAVKPVYQKMGLDAALELIDCDLPREAVERKAREMVAEEQHLDVGPVKYIRMIVSDEVYRKWEEMCHCVRNAQAKPYVSDSELVEAIAAEVMSGIDIRHPCFEDIRAGRVKCIVCGVLYPVQRHHAIPRSHKFRRADGSIRDVDDDDWPIVYLCSEHHRRVTEGEGGTWRAYLKTWMSKDDDLRKRVEAFLDGRSLDEI